VCPPYCSCWHWDSPAAVLLLLKVAQVPAALLLLVLLVKLTHQHD
jgi:hypothetical protein